MPIYEYQCKKCGQFEVMQKITEAHLKRCPTCRGKVTKLISNTSFHLKGSGWYVTDYATQGRQRRRSPAESKDSKAETSTVGIRHQVVEERTRQQGSRDVGNQIVEERHQGQRVQRKPPRRERRLDHMLTKAATGNRGGLFVAFRPDGLHPRWHKRT